MAERWRAVVGFERYRVSDKGRVKNIRSGRILKGAVNRDGYAVMYLRPEKGKPRTLVVHRLVCAAFLGPPGPGQVCNHISGVKRDNRAKNLEWCSRAENAAHAARLGLCRGQPGEKNPKAKLRDVDVIEMRLLSSLGASYTDLGRHFGVTPHTAYRAVVGQTWSHLARSPA